MTTWCVPDGRQLHWYERDGEAVVFNAQSGRSHYLNTMATEMLRFIEEAPRSFDDIRTHFSSIFEDLPVPNLESSIEKVVRGFVNQGLIDPCRQ